MLNRTDPQSRTERTRSREPSGLAGRAGKVRLVKGASDEPPAVAYREKARVDWVYRDLLAYVFHEFDDGVVVGSHDPALIEHAIDLHGEYGTVFEIQMLMGVHEHAQFDPAADYPVYRHVPFGDRWFSYFYRRVRGRKGNALFAPRAVLGR